MLVARVFIRDLRVKFRTNEIFVTFVNDFSPFVDLFLSAFLANAKSVASNFSLIASL